MKLNDDFKDPFDFARLCQTHPEVKEAVMGLMSLRRLLMEHNALTGFKARIMGFDITCNGL